MFSVIFLLLLVIKDGTGQIQGIVNNKNTAVAPQSIDPLTSSQLIFLNTVTNIGQPGVHSATDQFTMAGQSPRITAEMIREIDWSQIDRRTEEGWWHLYPFGERFLDAQLSHRPWMDKQIDLDFFFPYYGFRFNYTFLFHEGFIAFSNPWFIQPPYTFPNPHWPKKPDPAIIAAFMADQQMQHVGDTRISNVWYRILERPSNLIGYNNLQTDLRPRDMEPPGGISQPQGVFSYKDPRYYRTYRGRQLKTEEGRLEDPEMLDQITHDIRHSMVGARGWKADYAMIVTWERMSYGGAPKVTRLDQYEQAKRWQNTYQLVIATDEIRSYVMLNYAHINWTSSTMSGSLTRGRGGKQSALVGFNGGNGTGWYEMPFSADGDSYKLVRFGSSQIAGRWLARVDEYIQYGGCNNDSRGSLKLSQEYGNMLGGFALNVSGPCFRLTDVPKLQFDELTVDCERIDMIFVRCVIPVNRVFRTGLVDLRLSVDGGKNYAWWTKFYVLQPGLAQRRVNLINDVRQPHNNWHAWEAENLTVHWEWENITSNPNTQVDIALYGYWEDVEGHSFKQIGYIARRHPNNGAYTFTPRTMQTDFEADIDAWRFYRGGVVQVRVADMILEDRGDIMHWSEPIPFGWFFHKRWEYEWGREWPLRLCQEWFDWDGRRENFIMELEPNVPCPCTLSQAQLDFGRFTAHPECDMSGDHSCTRTQGALHCVISSAAVWTGAGQMCCYDYEGWLMFSDDFEFNDQYLRFYSAGVPYRAHPFGSYPYKRPPYVPTMSNFYNDLLPYDFCCKWAGHCEFFFWRRQTSTCQEYRPPVIGYIYGENHFTTYDGTRFSFHGKGYYVLSMMKSPRHDLMIQGRMEQPADTIWEEPVKASILTGIAARDNGSSVVQVFARKDFRRWRYKTDVYVDGVRIFFDMPWQKIHTFQGVTVRVPPRNMNQSEIEIMFATGVGLKIEEARGLLNIIVALPASYNQTSKMAWHPTETPSLLSIFDETTTQWIDPALFSPYGACAYTYRTVGLLGTYNQNPNDDFTTPECGILHSASNQRQLFYEFGERWRLDLLPNIGSLFQPEHRPLYDPLSFADPFYEPVFDPWLQSNYSHFESLVFSRDEVRVMCQGVPSCEYDYLMSGRRELALETLDSERKFEQFKKKGEVRLKSCGPLMKNPGVIKFPPGNNYLDGVTVSFMCKPEYFLHGDQQRTCINGTWSPGWWVWCRDRSEETALKWMTGILSSVAILLALIAIFVFCILTGKQRQAEHIRRQKIIETLKKSPEFMQRSLLTPNTPPQQRETIIYPKSTEDFRDRSQISNFASPRVRFVNPYPQRVVHLGGGEGVDFAFNEASV